MSMKSLPVSRILSEVKIFLVNAGDHPIDGLTWPNARKRETTSPAQSGNEMCPPLAGALPKKTQALAEHLRGSLGELLLAKERQRLGIEGRIARHAPEREVELGDSKSQGTGPGALRREDVLRVVPRWLGMLGDELRQSIESALPGTAVIRNEGLQNAEGRGGASARSPADRAFQPRRVGIARLAKETTHLEIGTLALVEQTENLEDEAFAIDDRRVGLLDAQCVRGKVRDRGRRSWLRFAQCRLGLCAGLELQRRALADNGARHPESLQDRAQSLGIDQCVAEQPAARKTLDDVRRSFLFELVGARPGFERQRERVMSGPRSRADLEDCHG